MNIDESVRKYVAEFLDIPIESINDDFDVITDVNWDERESDENIGELLEDFVEQFNVYVPERNFSEYSHSRKIPRIVAFFLRPFFPFIWKKMQIQHLKISDMINIAKSRYWKICKK